MGEPEPIPFAVPDIGEAEIEAVTTVLRSRWLTTGRQAHEFEQRFAARVGARHAVALNSATAALHLSLEALGVGPGDLVFLSPYTFAASAEVIRYLGARPVFVDIDPVTLNIDVDALAESLAAHSDGALGTPRAIMPVHIAGVPCAMDAIWDLARAHHLAVVEDAAHAFPSGRGGRPVGTVPAGIRSTVCFSFYATKTITTGEGGMLVTDDADIADRARSMSLHGLSRQAWSRYTEGGSWAYDITAPGYKYNLTDIAAAMGLVQLERAEQMRTRRAEIAAAYSAALAGRPGVQLPADPDDVQHSWHLYVLRVPDRDALIARLSAARIGTSVHFIPLHLHSYYAKTYGCTPADHPIATREFERAVSLPIHSTMTDQQVQRVIDEVSAALGATAS